MRSRLVLFVGFLFFSSFGHSSYYFCTSDAGIWAVNSFVSSECFWSLLRPSQSCRNAYRSVYKDVHVHSTNLKHGVYAARGGSKQSCEEYRQYAAELEFGDFINDPDSMTTVEAGWRKYLVLKAELDRDGNSR